MVSQPDHVAYPTASLFSSSSSSAAAGPARIPLGASQSVVSRPAASSRSRRYNRSHTGVTGGGGGGGVGVGGRGSGSDPYGAPPLNEFPVFNHSGDVEIIVKAGGVGAYENRYLLHKHILTRCSGFFEASTSLEWSRATNALSESPVGIEAAPSPRELARIAEDVGTGADVDTLLRLRERGTGGGDRNTRPRWRYELDRGPGDSDVPMLVQKPAPPPVPARSLFGGDHDHYGAPPYGTSYGPPGASSLSRSKTHHPSSSSGNPFLRSVANLSINSANNPPAPLSLTDQDLMRDYDNLFRIFYNYAPVLDGVNIADAYVQCKSLLSLADQYDALAVVGPRVDHHMLQFQSRLWRQIAKYPISYLRLGFLARSKVIFQEALIHVVGQWPVGERSLRSALPDAVLHIIEDKVDELDELVGRVEGRLFRLGLTTSRGERVTPSTSYLDWLALSLFRQWIAENTTPTTPADDAHSSSRSRREPPSHVSTAQSSSSSSSSPPHLASVGRAYRTLGSANQGLYLSHDDCKRFLKLSPEIYNRDNLRRFEKRIDDLKSMARDIVRPLMGSGLELELAGAGGRSGDVAGGITYLTCTKLADRDLPWPVEE